MSCGQDCVRWCLIIGVFGISTLFLSMIKKWDKDFAVCNRKDMRKGQIIFCVMSIGLFAGQEIGTIQSALGIMALGIYLVVCSVTDMLLCQVHDVMQYLGMMGAFLWLWKKDILVTAGFSVIFFALVQYVLFMRMYGKADGMAFCICALYLTGKGAEIEGYLYHMAISFLMLAVVQLCKKNVSIKGKLKQQVALYPYITAGFCVIWWYIR